MAVTTGDLLPHFTLPNQHGALVHISEYVGKQNLVIFFYPKDNTAGCTAEVCSFRDTYEEFVGLDAAVFGISSDDPKKHLQFIGRHDLPFQLLADTDKAVRRLFGVPGNLFGLIPGRVTYIIDRKGVVRGVYNSQLDPTGHVDHALKTLNEIAAAEETLD